MKNYQTVRDLADCLLGEAYAAISADNFRDLFPSSKMISEGRERATQINASALDRAIVELKKEFIINLWDVDATYASGHISNGRRIGKTIPGSVSARVIFVLQSENFIRVSVIRD